MSTELKIIIVLAALVVVLFLLWRRAQKRLAAVAFAKQSLSSKYGKMTEQFLPFLANYPYDPQLFRFLGTPIDGIQFTDDKIVLLEFKTSDSQLSSDQRKIRQLVKDKKISFEEHRVES